MNSLLQIAAKKQFEASYTNLVNLIDPCPDEIWSKNQNGCVYCQQLLHTFISICFWMRNTGIEFREPLVKYELYPRFGRTIDITKPQLTEYVARVNRVIDVFMSVHEKESLFSPSSVYGKISSLDVVIMQIRHIQYHAGICETILPNGPILKDERR